MIALRKGNRAFGRGSFEIVEVKNPHIFAFERVIEGQRVVCLFNFARSMQSVAVPVNVSSRTEVRDLIGGSSLHAAVAKKPYQMTLGPRGYAWLQIG